MATYVQLLHYSFFNNRTAVLSLVQMARIVPVVNVCSNHWNLVRALLKHTSIGSQNVIKIAPLVLFKWIHSENFSDRLCTIPIKLLQ